MKDTYEINRATLVLFSLDGKTTKIYEKEEEYIVSKSSLKIIDDSCKYFGSSFLGREAGSRNLIGSDYKVPIIIEESRRMIFIPTSSPKFSSCDWISYNHIDHYEKNGLKTRIVFDNGKAFNFDISIYSLENQILRAMKLENTLRNRLEKIERV